MTIQNRKSFAFASVFSVVLALAASSGIASAMDSDGDDGVKSAACGVIGCADGARECAKATGTLKAGIPPWVGEVSVTYTCYEAPAI